MIVTTIVYLKRNSKTHNHRKPANTALTTLTHNCVYTLYDRTIILCASNCPRSHLIPANLLQHALIKSTADQDPKKLVVKGLKILLEIEIDQKLGLGQENVGLAE